MFCTTTSIAQACYYYSLYIPFSDERAMKRVVPQLFQDNAELYEKVVEVSAQLLLPDTHMI